MKNKTTLLNVLTSIFVQIFSVISALIIPRLVLSCFGSDINGLVASISQVLSFVVLVEGGVTGVIIANLYKPLIEQDNDRLSSVLVTAKQFNQKIGVVFMGYTMVVACVYPLIKNTGFNNGYVAILTVILSIGSLAEYMFALTLRTLLTADKKVYLINLVKMLMIILNIILSVVSVRVYPNILLLKLVNTILFFVQPLVFGWYVKKRYSINWNCKPDSSLLKSRWDGFAINIAAYIHECTDIVVLTIFTSFSEISVYSIYILILNKLKQFIVAITDSLNPTIGQAYAKGDINELNQKMDLYEYITFFLTCYAYSMVGLLIAPFAMIYTKGITDANYYQPILGWLIVVAEILYLVKFPHVNLSYSANKFKDITIHAYLEAFLNIFISIICVFKFGMIGVVFGTIIAMAYRMIFHVWYTKKLIPGRRQVVFYKKFLVFTITSMIGVLLCSFLMPINGYVVIDWIWHALCYGVVLGVFLVFSSFIFFKNELFYFVNYIKR